MLSQPNIMFYQYYYRCYRYYYHNALVTSQKLFHVLVNIAFPFFHPAYFIYVPLSQSDHKTPYKDSQRPYNDVFGDVDHIPRGRR